MSRLGAGQVPGFWPHTDVCVLTCVRACACRYVYLDPCGPELCWQHAGGCAPVFQEGRNSLAPTAFTNGKGHRTRLCQVLS